MFTSLNCADVETCKHEYLDFKILRINKPLGECDTNQTIPLMKYGSMKRSSLLPKLFVT